MTKPVISVERLSKAYRIGLKEEIPDTLMGAVTSWLKAPVRNWRRLRRLDTSAALLKEVAQASQAERPTPNVQRLTSNGHIPPLPPGEGRGDGEAASNGHASHNGQSTADNGHPSTTPHSARRIPHSDDIIWALRDVSFDVQEGEVVGIIGRNGAGKSTLLKILSRITEPTSGRAVIRGRVSSLLEVGTGFHPELTGRENIYMNGTVLGMTKREIDRKFDEIVDFSGVERFLDTPIKRYSSGMQVRLAFSVAAHLEPEILIIDEVLAVGDAEFQRKCLGKMNEVSRSGRTILFVSHNMGAILELCEKAALLHSGHVALYGATEQVVAHYGRASTRYPGSYVDLSRSGRRTTSGRPIFAGLRLLNDKGAPIDQFCCGSSIRFELTLDPHPSSERLNLRIAVEDHLGLVLFHIGTHLSSHGPVVLSGRRQVSCMLDDLPLVPGQYHVTLMAGWSGTVLDRVDRAISFDVLPADFYGSGRIPHTYQGRFLVRSHWCSAPS